MKSDDTSKLVAEIDAALSRNLAAIGVSDGGAQLGDWIVVCSAPSLDGEGEPWSAYSLLASGNLMEHNALGLLQKGISMMEDGE